VEELCWPYASAIARGRITLLQFITLIFLSMTINEFSGSLLVGGMDTLEDDDDEDLQSFMTGLSMTRTALRRNGGGCISRTSRWGYGSW
jgi:hypothetical protein